MKLGTSIEVLLILLATTLLSRNVAGFATRPAMIPRQRMELITASRCNRWNTLSKKATSVSPGTAARLFAFPDVDSGEDVTIQLIGLEEMEEILHDLEHEQDGGYSGYCVLDVRSVEEVEATGKLSPSVITCPLPHIKETHAFELHPQDFLEEFGFPKPHFDDTLVFTCAAGKRAQIAAELAAADGYPNIVVYTGGASEWFGPPDVDVP